jgi:hypothetical protein
MSLQKRPLSGMTVVGTQAAVPRAVPVAPALPATIHTLDTTAPYLDQVTLFVHNNDAGAQDVSVIVAGSPAIVVAVPANTTRTVFLDQPFYGVQGQPAQSDITVQAVGGAGMVAWGHFTR